VANTSFLVQFFSSGVATASGYGPGEKLFGSTTVVTTAGGSVSFNATILAFLSLGSQVSATATNLTTGDTSEFSLDYAYEVTTQLSAAAYTVSDTGGAVTVVVIRSSGSSSSAVTMPPAAVRRWPASTTPPLRGRWSLALARPA